MHPEKIPSAMNRYDAEIKRVLGVLDRSLEDGKQWLVGDKMTYADLAFVSWNVMLEQILASSLDEIFEGLPNARAWYDRLAALPSWQRTAALRVKYMAEQNLGITGQPNDSEVSLAEYAAQHDAPKTT